MNCSNCYPLKHSCFFSSITDPEKDKNLKKKPSMSLGKPAFVVFRGCFFVFPLKHGMFREAEAAANIDLLDMDEPPRLESRADLVSVL